jgi:Flp pilus assembly protein TadG
MKLFKNNHGAAAVEFALVALPVLLFMFGIMQTAYLVWADNMLHVSVDAAARCGGVNSTTSPCNGLGLANMQSTANTVFRPLSGATFSANATCTADNGSGLVGTYTVNFLQIVNLTLTARSCYPNLS